MESGQYLTNLCLVYYFAALLDGGRVGKGGFLCIYHLGGHCVGAEAPVDCFVSRIRLWRGMMFNPAEIFYFHIEKKSHGIHTLGF